MVPPLGASRRRRVRAVDTSRALLDHRRDQFRAHGNRHRLQAEAQRPLATVMNGALVLAAGIAIGAG